MDDRILHHLEGVDEIWHGGDIGNLEVTDALKELAPLRGVYGNIDGGDVRREFPLDQRFRLEGLDIWISHIVGRPGRYYQRARAILEKGAPDILVCGHSHICLVERDKKYGLSYMNPGAAGRHGFHHMRTLLRFTLDRGRIEDLEVVELGRRGKEA